MQYTTGLLATMALAGSALAQRPANMSVCDYYTGALLKDNTAENQLKVLTLVVNTAVIGNYTKPSIPGVKFPDVAVPGILNPNGTINGTKVNLVPYFNGGLASSNRGGKTGVSVNFLDDGGAAPLMENKPSNGMDSNQYLLLTHLYQFFGTLLGCSQQGMTGYPNYQGFKSMYTVHKFMDLNYAEMSYFVEQVGLSAASFGVSKDDVEYVGKALNMYFNVKCAAPVTLAPTIGSQLQSICIAEDCPLAMNNTCSMYEAAFEPGVTNSTLAMGEGNKTSTATMTAANGGMPTGTASGSAGAASGTAKASGVSTAGAASMAGSGLAAGLAAVAMLL